MEHAAITSLTGFPSNPERAPTGARFSTRLHYKTKIAALTEDMWKNGAFSKPNPRFDRRYVAQQERRELSA